MAEQRLGRECPYCGGVPYLYREYEQVGGFMQFSYLIRCSQCGCTTHWHDDWDDVLEEFYQFEVK